MASRKEKMRTNLLRSPVVAFLYRMVPTCSGARRPPIAESTRRPVMDIFRIPIAPSMIEISPVTPCGVL
jgi:hypothetical protein